MSNVWYKNKAVVWVLILVFLFTSVFNTGTAFAGTAKTHNLGSEIEDIGIYLWEYSEVYGCDFTVKDDLIVVYGRHSDSDISYDEKISLMVRTTEDVRVYADNNGIAGTERDSIRISKMSEELYYGYLWLSDAEGSVNERYLIKLMVPGSTATNPDGSASDPNGDFTYPDEEIVIPEEEEPYFNKVIFSYNSDEDGSCQKSSKGVNFKGETYKKVIVNYNANYGELSEDIMFCGTDVNGNEFECPGTFDENGECIISFDSINGKTYTVKVLDGAYRIYSDMEFYVDIWDGKSWRTSYEDDGSKKEVERTLGLHINLDEAATEEGQTIKVPAFYDEDFGIKAPTGVSNFTGYEDVYYLDEDGKATMTFSAVSVNGKKVYNYKVNFVLDENGGTADLTGVKIMYEDTSSWEMDSIELALGDVMETGQLVYEIPAGIYENWDMPYVSINTEEFSIVQYEADCASDPDGVEERTEWGGVEWFPDFSGDGVDTFVFTVTSADGNSEKEYVITLKLEGMATNPDGDEATNPDGQPAEDPTDMTVIYNERVGEYNISRFTFDEENYKEVIINRNGDAAEGGIIPENVKLTGTDVNGDYIELEGTLDENGECIISFTSANGEDYTVKIIDGAYLIYSDMEFYVNVWDGKSWETLYEEDGSEKEVERTLAIGVDLDEAATEEGQTIKIPAFYNEDFGIKAPTGRTGFTGYEDVYYLDEDGKASMAFSAVSANGKKVYNYKVNFVLDENGGTADLTGVKIMYEDTSSWEMNSIELDVDDAMESGQLVYEIPADFYENWYMPYVVINTEDFATVQYETGTATDPDGIGVGSEWGGTNWFPDFGDNGYDTFTFTVTSADGSKTQEYTIILCLEGLAEYPEEEPAEEPYNMYAGVAHDGSWAEQQIMFDGENQATAFFDPQEIFIESDEVRLTGTDVDGTSIELYGQFDENGECEITFTSANGKEYTVKYIDGGYNIWTDIELYAQVWDGKTWEYFEEDGSPENLEKVCFLPIDLEAAESEEGQTVVVPYYYDADYGIRMEGAASSFDGLDDVYYLDDEGKATAEFTCHSANGKVTHSYKFNFVKDTSGESTDLEVLQLRWRERINGKTVWGFEDVSISDAAGSKGAVVEIPDSVLEKAQKYGIYVYSYDYAYFEYPSTDENGEPVTTRDLNNIVWTPVFGDNDYDVLDFNVISANGQNKQDYRVTVVREGSEYEPPEKDIPCVEHTYGEWEVIEKATCTEPGVKKHVCTECQQEEFMAIPATGHEYTSEKVEPTCIDKGYIIYTCKCGDSYTEDIPAVKHVTNKIEAYPATCEKDGYIEHYICDGCGGVFLDEAGRQPVTLEETVVPATGHAPGDEMAYDDEEHWYVCGSCFECLDAAKHEYAVTDTTDGSCTEPGSVTYTCECGAEYTGETGLAEHVMTWIEEYPATCEKDGYIEHYICDECGEAFLDEAGKEPVAIEDTVIEAIGHEPGDEMVYDDEKHWYVCGNCSERLDIADHEYAVTDTTDATCTEPGSVTYTCECGAEYTEETDVAEHVMTGVEGYPATCEEDGYIEHYICDECGEAFLDEAGKEPVAIEDTEIPALGHDKVKHKGKAATCTAKGWKAYETCSRCDYTTYKEIKAKGHKWEEFYTVDKKATTKAAGSKSRHCATCNAVKSGSKVTIAKISKTTADTLVYNGKNRTNNVKVVNSKGGKLVKGTSYTVTYKNAKGKVVTPKNVGTYKAVVKFKGQYSGSVTKTFKINPQSTKITKLTKGKKRFTVKWTKKTAQVTGYQIKYSTKSSMKNAKTVTVTKAKTTKKTIKKLKAKQKYYVQIRTYKTVNGTKYYSAWSAKKSIKTK